MNSDLRILKELLADFVEVRILKRLGQFLASEPRNYEVQRKGTNMNGVGRREKGRGKSAVAGEKRRGRTIRMSCCLTQRNITQIWYQVNKLFYD